MHTGTSRTTRVGCSDYFKELSCVSAWNTKVTSLAIKGCFRLDTSQNIRMESAEILSILRLAGKCLNRNWGLTKTFC